MRRFYLKSSLLLLAIFTSSLLIGQNRFFSDAGENKLVETTGQRIIVPLNFRTTSLDVQAMKNFLWSLPSEQNFLNNRAQAPVLSLPMPDGSLARFHVWESSIQEPSLAAKFPEIKTFAGQGIDDPYATIRFDYNPYFGFSAQILSPNGRIYIDPFARRDIHNYISYYQRDNRRRSPLICSVEDSPTDEARIAAGPCLGTQLRTYRLAISCTGEYAVAVGLGAAGPTHAAIVASANRITGVYEVELAVRLVLVANNNLIEYLDGTTDPFTNTISGTLLNQNQTNTDAVIGFSNYDIGHIFTSDDNGLAGLGVVCSSSKARGATGSPVLIGDGFDIDYVAHEMGHEFGATHSFNSNTCASAGGSYEPGSGTTIMAYAGICGATENIQPNSDPIFHAISFDQIGSFITSGGGSTCAVVTSTGNTLPVITSISTNNLSIPINTPFTLSGTATDANGDAITYNWEGLDVGAAGSWPSAANSTTRPLFRTRVSKTTGSRTFPDIRVIAANYPGTAAPSVMDGLRGEVLPQVARTMKFRLTVRDNRAGGGGVVSSGDGCQDGTTFQVNAVGTTPFVVTAPNGGESWPAGSLQTITWNVAGTNTAPISVANVKITLSTDGGLTYPTVVTASTTNDGSETLAIPGITTTTARIKIEAIGNIFFDISNNNFTISAPVSSFDFDSPTPVTAPCGGPVTTLAISLGTQSTGGYNTPINLSASNVPSGANVTFGTNPVTPGSPSLVTLNNVNTLSAGSYNITIIGVSGVFTRTRIITYTILPGVSPVISTQPASQSICTGSNVTFNVASATALSYQWEISTNGGGLFLPIPGANSSSLTVNTVATGQNNYQYHCIVTGQCNSTISNAAILTVMTGPTITNHPQSVTLCIAASNTFTSTASGSGLSYQWQLSTNGGGSFNNIVGANGPGYTLTGITAGMNNNQYRVIISGTCAPSATSNAAILTVISPVIVTTQPANNAICEMGNVSFTVAGSGAGVLYQWQVSTNGGGSYSDINGATSATLNLNSVSSSMNNNLYRALLSNPICTTPTPSNGAILTVNPRPTATLSASPYTRLFPGLSTTITATIFPSPTGFNITWNRNGTMIPGATGTTYTTGITGLGDYTVNIVNTVTGCNNQSNVLRITDSANSRLFIYPSPNDGQFTLVYHNYGGVATHRTVTIYNAIGAKVYHAKFAMSGPYQLLDINLKPAARGVYTVVLGDAFESFLAKGRFLIYY